MRSKAQLNAISRSYKAKRDAEAKEFLQKQADKQGITVEQYQAQEKARKQAEAKARAKAKADERRAICKQYGVKTLAEVEEIKDNELLQEIKNNLSKGIYRISKVGNIIDNATNNMIDVKYSILRKLK